MSPRPCIILYNPISNEGHLDSWHALFVDAFLTAGWAVIAMTSDLSALKKQLDQKGLEGHPALSLRSTTGEKTATSTHAGIPVNILRNTAKRLEAFLPFNLSQLLRQAKGLLQSRDKRELAALAAKYLNPQLFCEQVNEVLTQQSKQVSAVFNMYVDAYMPIPSAWQNFTLAFSTPWASLSITPSPLEVVNEASTLPPYYFLQGYRGTCFLDESPLKRYQAQWPDKQFEYLPDITETSLPAQPSALAQSIKQLAAGRKIVFMGGSIGKQKNLVEWIRLIQRADSSKWFFVQIGRINTNNLTSEDKKALVDIKAATPKNLFIQETYVADESVFNEIITLADVIFAVYKDFYRSSNMLSKAAYFEKPILVAHQCLMGERVARYGIGLAVAPNDSDAIHQALVAAPQLPKQSEHFAAYRKDFNQQALQNKLISFVHACLLKESSAPLLPSSTSSS
jgi:hypothetical protein